MAQSTARQIAQGEYVTFTDIAEPKAAQVWVRNHYDRASKKYSFTNFDDCNKEKFVAGDKACFIGFSF